MSVFSTLRPKTFCEIPGLKPIIRLYKALDREALRKSQKAVFVCSAADFVSTATVLTFPGMMEINPVLSSDGTIGAAGYATKAVITCGALFLENWLMTHTPTPERKQTSYMMNVGNCNGAGLTLGLSVNNVLEVMRHCL